MAFMAHKRSSGDKLTALKACLARVAEDRDRGAFAQLFDHYAPLIRAYSLAREPGADLVADELVQEVLSRVWLKADKYNERLANLNTWIFTLARNCRIDYLRRNSRYVTEIDPTDIFNDIEDEGPGPFQQVQQTRAEESIQNRIKTTATRAGGNTNQGLSGGEKPPTDQRRAEAAVGHRKITCTPGVKETRSLD